MNRVILSLAALAAGLAVTAAPAEAKVHRGHVVNAQGAYGHGFSHWRSASRERGSAKVERGFETNNGRGYKASRSLEYGPGRYSSERDIQANNSRGVTNSRDASWGDSSYSGSHVIEAHDGRTRSRDTSAFDNGDGTANYASTLTRANGSSRTVSGTIPRR